MYNYGAIVFNYYSQAIWYNHQHLLTDLGLARMHSRLETECGFRSVQCVEARRAAAAYQSEEFSEELSERQTDSCA